MQKLKPLNDHVVLKPISKEQQKVGNIVIPDMGHEKPLLAIVIEMGRGIFNYHQGKVVPPEIKVGDTVVIPKMGATVVSLDDGEDYYICQAQQLLAVVE